MMKGFAKWPTLVSPVTSWVITFMSGNQKAVYQYVGWLQRVSMTISFHLKQMFGASVKYLYNSNVFAELNFVALKFKVFFCGKLSH